MRGTMRRAGKAMTEDQARNSLASAYIGRLATVGVDGYPYVVPLNIGYVPSAEGHGVIYFHSATEGHKLTNILHNPCVCIQADHGAQLVKGEAPCDWSMSFRSVVAFGRARVVTDPEERLRGLVAILGSAGMPELGTMKPEALAKTQVVAVHIETLTGKQSG